MVEILGLCASPSQLCKLMEVTAAFSKRVAGPVFTAFKVPRHSALENLQLVPSFSYLACGPGLGGQRAAPGLVLWRLQ